MKKQKRIKVGKGVYLSVKKLRKIHLDLKQKNLEITKENILDQHYILQTAHPFKRIIVSLMGLFFMALGVYLYQEIYALIIFAIIGVILFLAGVRGRKKDINDVVDFTTTTIDGVGTVAGVIFSVISAFG